LIVVLIVGLGLGLVGPQAWAWTQLHAARTDLARYHPDAAQTHLARCLRVWPSSLEAHLLASRAARQRGDFAEADQQLRTCQRLLDGTSNEVAQEWALLQAASGNLGEVEEYLQRRTEEDPELPPL